MYKINYFKYNGGIVSCTKIKCLCWKALITLTSTNELTFISIMTRTLALHVVDIVGIGVEQLTHVRNIRNDNSFYQ